MNPTKTQVSAVTALVEHICVRSGQVSLATTSYCKSQALRELYSGSSPAKAVQTGLRTMADIISATVVDQVLATIAMRGQGGIVFTEATRSQH